MTQSNPGSGVALRLDAPPTLIAALAHAVADELERRGTTPTSPASPYLDVTEAARYLRCKPQRLYDLVSAGSIEPSRDGKRLLFRRDALDGYLAGAAGGDER